MNRRAEPIAVIGAGSWGTALAILLARNGVPTRLWGRDSERMAQMQAERCNRRYLPEIPFPDDLLASAALDQVLAGVGDVLVVVPSHGFRTALQTVAPHLEPAVHIAWASKGLEEGSNKLLHQVAGEELPGLRAPTVISGPTFAREVARGLPTAVTVASPDPEMAQHFAARLHGRTFRPYTSSDIIGVELGGAVKNVLAIAAGIADGLGFGANTRAALITRGLVEMSRLGLSLGAQQETFIGLAGLGDLVLTCTDNQSRNRRLGLALGEGKNMEEARAAIDQVVEGIKTAAEIHALARRQGVEMPITEQVYRVLYQDLAPQAAVEALLARETKEERA
jgi:glycerol-3-phosphate dehydrogenase (NAD(P)+)